MRLPFADEIRVARRAAEEASRAATDLVRIGSAQMSVGVFQGQLRFRPDLELDPLPGEPLVQALAESWPVLADLGSSTPRSAESTPLRLQVRGQQLESARQALRQLASEAHQLASELHELEHRQRHALEEPRWAAAAAELGRLIADRDEVMRDLRPTEQRAAMLRPMAAVVDPFLFRLREELAARDQPDPRGFVAWRAVTLARSILEALAAVLTPIHMEIPVPPPPPRPGEPDPDPEVRATLWWDVEGICDRLGELSETIASEATRLEEQRQQLAQRLDELTRGILERTG